MRAITGECASRAEVIDRPKGYFPVPALVELEGRTSSSYGTR
ncbi:hypothetical protein [Capillimicrobium parvum]|nr:hypothetical protein [Capillimicrobium parvum]